MRLKAVAFLALSFGLCQTPASATVLTYSFSGTSPIIYDPDYNSVTAAEAAYLGLQKQNHYTLSFSFDAAAPDDYPEMGLSEFHGPTATIDVNGHIFTGTADAVFILAGPVFNIYFRTLVGGDFFPDIDGNEFIKAEVSFQLQRFNPDELPLSLANLNNVTYPELDIYMGAQPLGNAPYYTAGLRDLTLPTITTTVTDAVPEPEIWALMMVGFGALGITMRRTRTPSLRLAHSFGG